MILIIIIVVVVVVLLLIFILLIVIQLMMIIGPCLYAADVRGEHPARVRRPVVRHVLGPCGPDVHGLPYY